MTQPTSNITEVLYKLIVFGKVIGTDFSFVDYRKRLSELKLNHNIEFDSIPTKFANKYGKYSICSAYVLKSSKDYAIDVYNRLNKTSE